MTDLIRDAVKYVRDGAKAAYVKDSECYICEATEELQFHHFYSVTQLWNKWVDKNNIIINNTDDIFNVRGDFISEYHDHIYKDTVTLCKSCHNERLHKIYGKSPLLHTAPKQQRWCEKQRIKWKEKHKGEKA
jgi:hypothetical protein